VATSYNVSLAAATWTLKTAWTSAVSALVSFRKAWYAWLVHGKAGRVHLLLYRATCGRCCQPMVTFRRTVAAARTLLVACWPGATLLADLTMPPCCCLRGGPYSPTRVRLACAAAATSGAAAVRAFLPTLRVWCLLARRRLGLRKRHLRLACPSPLYGRGGLEHSYPSNARFTHLPAAHYHHTRTPRATAERDSSCRPSTCLLYLLLPSLHARFAARHCCLYALFTTCSSHTLFCHHISYLVPSLCALYMPPAFCVTCA